MDVELRTPDDGYRATATTLGAGGLFVEMANPLIEGTSLNLRCKLPDGDEYFTLLGRVVWSTPPATNAGSGGSSQGSPGIGIEFTDKVMVSKIARRLEFDD